ncbi:hypothetical protein JHK87_004397 [Glycine soja]|nr:hypothetical protein JHK87_004397 [Glycine soja]
MLCASTNSDTICLVIIQDQTRYAIHYGKPSSRLINVQMRCMEVHIQPNHHDDLLCFITIFRDFVTIFWDSSRAEMDWIQWEVNRIPQIEKVEVDFSFLIGSDLRMNYNVLKSENSELGNNAVTLEPDMTPRLGSFVVAEFLSRNEHGHHVISNRSNLRLWILIKVRSCGFKAVVPKTRLKFRGTENVQNGNGKFQFGSPHPLEGTDSKKTNAKTEKIEANLCRIAILVTLISKKIENVMYVKTVLRRLGAQHIYSENQITEGNNQKMKRNIVTFGDMLRKTACPRVLITEVYAATNLLNEMNIIGKGTLGKVYKGTMTNNLNVAIKHIINDDGNVDTFVREITSLSHVRHPNISSCKQSQFTWCQLKVELNKEYA